jgi:hypothetical protein
MHQQQRLRGQAARPITCGLIHQAYLSDGRSRIQHDPRAPPSRRPTRVASSRRCPGAGTCCAAIGQVLADCVLAPAQVAGNNSTLLVDGTIAPTWDWSAIPDLFSGKAGYAGMNIQIAATMTGQVAAIGPIPVRGAPTRRTRSRGTLHDSQATFNISLSAIRTGVEHAIAHLKTWRMLSEEGGRYRPPPPNTARCSRPSPAFSSSAITFSLMNKPPGGNQLPGQWLWAQH